MEVVTVYVQIWKKLSEGKNGAAKRGVDKSRVEQSRTTEHRMGKAD